MAEIHVTSDTVQSVQSLIGTTAFRTKARHLVVNQQWTDRKLIISMVSVSAGSCENYSYIISLNIVFEGVSRCSGG